jgi:hypothetical protein
MRKASVYKVEITPWAIRLLILVAAIAESPLAHAQQPTITSATSATGTTGTAFSYQITASNSASSYSATGLPAGLSVDSSTGLISGTPSATGTSMVTLGATNSFGTGNATLTLTIATLGQSALVANTSFIVSGSGNRGTSSAINTTGATFLAVLVVSFGGHGGCQAGNITDSNSNTWTLVQEYDYEGSGRSICYWYAASPTVGSGHTFSLSNSYYTVAFPAAYSGVATTSPLDVQTGNSSGSSIALSSGSVTTNYNGELCLAGGNGYFGGSDTSWSLASPSVAMTLANYQESIGGNNTGGVSGYYVQSTAGSISTTAVPAGAVADEMTAAIACFQASGSSPAQPPVISSSTTATGTTGSAFSYQITASNSPISFSATGLPGGLSVNTSTGLISGTPTATGTSMVALGATNSGGTGNATLTLTVNSPAQPPVITSSTTATGTTGTAFSYQITASNSPSSYSATGLPAGLSVDSSTGLISGTPSATGTSMVTLGATNSFGTGNATLTLTIATLGQFALVANTSFIVSGSGNRGTSSAINTTGATFLAVLVVSFGGHGGCQAGNITDSNSNTWTLVQEYDYEGSGRSICYWYAASPTVGSGHTFSLSNSYYTVAFPAAYSGVATTSPLDVQTGNSSGSSIALSSGSVTTNYNGELCLAGGNGYFGGSDTSWSLASPSVAMTLANYQESIGGNNTGGVSGYYVQSTAGSISTTAVPAGAVADEMTAAIACFQASGSSPAQPPVISSSTTATGTTGSAFSYQITASNSPISFSATGLPGSLSVNTSTGLISGTPTATGTSMVALGATNSGGTGNATLTLTVNSPAQPPVITSSTTATGATGTAFGYQITASNSASSYSATGLPAGLSVDSSTGLISGTPSATGTSMVTLGATNSFGTGNATLTLTIATLGQSALVANTSFIVSGSGNRGTSSAINTTGATFLAVLVVSFGGHGGCQAGNITDSNSNTWTLVQEYDYEGSGRSICYWYAASPTVGSGHTFSLSNSYYTVAFPAAYSGVATTSPLDVQTGNSSGSSIALSSGSVTTNYNGELCLAGGNGYFGGSDTSWSLASPSVAMTLANYQESIGGNNTGGVSGYYVQSTAGSISTTAVPAGAVADEMTAAIACFQASGSSPAQPPVISSSTTATGTTGSAFSYQITASNSPISFSATGLPGSLSVNTSTGLISGTPTATGTSMVALGATNSGGTGNATLTLTVNSPAQPPVITSSTTATGATGTAFGYQITASNSASSYSATGLPAGLSVDSSTGLISGTPSATGTSMVTLGATNSFGTGNATLTLTIATLGQSALVANTSFIVSGSGNRGTSSAINTTGATFLAVLVVSFGGHGGCQAGNITDSNSNTWTLVQEYDYEGSGRSICYWYAASPTVGSGHTFSLSNSYYTVAFPAAYSGVATTSPLDVQTGNSSGSSIALSSGSVTTNYNGELCLAGGNGYFGGSDTSWSLASPSVAMTLANYQESIGGNNTGGVSGYYVQSTAGSISTTAVPAGAVADEMTAAIACFQASGSSPAQPPVISSSTTATGTTGSAFSYQITASNSPISFSATGLPGSLSVNTSTGLISGTPTATGTSMVALGATNSGGTGNATLTLTVNSPAQPPVITSSTTATGATGTAFGYQITASNSASSYSATGLPAGLSVDSSTGLISGTPSATGTSMVTLGATNSFGTGNATLTLTIATLGQSALVANTSFIVSGSGNRGTSSAINTTGATFLAVLVVSFGGHGGCQAGNITDSNSNTWTLVQEYDYEGSGRSICYWYAASPTVGSGHTFSLSNSYYTVAFPAAYSGVATTSPLDVQTGNSSGSSIALSSGSVTTNYNGELCLAGGNGYFGGSDTSWSLASPSVAMTLANYQESIGGNNTGGVSGYYVQSTAGSISTTAVPAGAVADEMTAAIACFQASGSSPTQPPVISSSTTATGTTGSAFSYQITASNSPISFSATGLPGGLSVNTSTGLISGTPTATGTSMVALGATNSVRGRGRQR